MCAVKISLITVCRNAKTTIERCIHSVAMQRYANVEYLVIDGDSDDGSRELILKNKACIHFFKSEPDNGMYEAINKGIRQATGDVIGILNADDYFADDEVLDAIAGCFSERNADVLYADLDYIDSKGRVVRAWRSGGYRADKFNFGWMPAHPTFYVSRKLFDQFGLYDVTYGSAADYELMLRYMYLNKVSACYLKKVVVKMRKGGMSNGSLKNRILAWRADFKAMKKNRIRIPWLAIVLKPLRKIPQFIFKPDAHTR